MFEKIINNDKIKVLDNTSLKIIALVCMLFDHVGIVFFPEYPIFRMIGRLAFPIFCFLLVEGFFYSNNLKRYFIRLFIFSLISEIPFDLLFFNRIYFSYQNIFFTLSLGLLTIFAIDSVLKIQKYYLGVVFAVAGMFIAWILKFDYSFRGIAIIIVFYMLKITKDIWKKLFLILTFVLLNFYGTQAYAILALILIYFYNGKRGGLKGKLNYVYYLVYPVHLIVIMLIKNYV